MSQSIDIFVYDIEKLKVALEKGIKPKKGQMKPSQLLDKVMPEAGIVTHGLFIMQNADAWEEYSPWNSIFNLIERYYSIDSAYDLFEKGQVGWKYDGIEEDELFEAAGIDPEEYPYEEEDE